MKQILFNTEMVRAILEGKKTVTRRPIKPQPAGEMRRMGDDSCYPGCFGEEGAGRIYRPPYMVGDVLYVRETWARIAVSPDGHFFPPGVYYYKAGPVKAPEGTLRKWSPSIHMPREAARIFLRVTAVRAERLLDMHLIDCEKEGVQLNFIESGDLVMKSVRARKRFAGVWDSTMKAEDRETYGWEADPWVWVIEFERISKEEAGLCQT